MVPGRNDAERQVVICLIRSLSRLLVGSERLQCYSNVSGNNLLDPGRNSNAEQIGPFPKVYPCTPSMAVWLDSVSPVCLVPLSVPRPMAASASF